MHVFVSAGEVSGDLHAARVIHSLARQSPGAVIRGIAGEAMVKAGCEPIVPMSSLNVMGLTDVVSALPRIYRAERQVLGRLADERPDVGILVDYPGFHMRLGRRLRRMGIPVLYYIAPKLWSWGAWRLRRLAESQDRLACILPFETAWFGERGIAADYVGNPSAAACGAGWSRSELCERYGVDKGARILALLPGSRSGEVRRHAQLLGGLAVQVRARQPGVVCVSPRAQGMDERALRPLTDNGVILLDRAEDGFALRADAAVAVSGTATLELALWDVPTVLIYRSTPLTIAVSRLLATVDCVGLANILLGQRKVMPELIQAECTIDHILHHLLPLLRGETAARTQRREFARLRQLLGERDPAPEVARMAIELAAR